MGMRVSLRGRCRAAALALVLGLGTTVVLVFPAGAQGAGNPGDVKIHDAVTDEITDNADNPKPCEPVLVAFNFLVGEQYTYELVTQPGGVVVIPPTTVTVSADPQQEPSSGDFTPPLLAGEMYKLRWDLGTSITNGSKQKVFKPTCSPPPENSPVPGAFEVTKTVSGSSAPTDWSFDVHVVCSGGFESDVVLSDESPTATVSNLDVGTTCTVTEVAGQGAFSPTYSPGQTSDAVQANETTTVTIDNHFVDTGGVDVTRPEAPPPAIITDPRFTG